MFLMRLLLREGKEGDGMEEEGKGRERREGGCLGLKSPQTQISGYVTVWEQGRQWAKAGPAISR